MRTASAAFYPALPPPQREVENSRLAGVRISRVGKLIGMR
jgi:hypothetical protein